MLKVEGLKVFLSGVRVLDGIELIVKEGEFVALLGANGSGKSTLLSALVGLVRCQEGQITFKEERLDSKVAYQIAELGIILSPEGRRLFPFMTVLENLILGTYSKRVRRRRREQLNRVFALMPLLFERQHQLAGSLSGGEQQMCAIGRALMADPELFILDEPTSGLSPLFVERVFSYLGNINQQGVSILLAEQNAQMALTHASRAYLLAEGKVVLEGSSDMVRQNNLLASTYLGM